MSPPSALVLCATCDRHRRVSDAACPFCGEVGASVGGPTIVRSLASRAALAFGGVALATAVSCSPKYGGPPPPDPSPPAPPTSSTVDPKEAPKTPSVEDAAAPSAPTPNTADASLPSLGTVPNTRGTGHAAAPAYGAPPRKK